ncbi:stalk-specific protein X [Phenylobacterium glaciei]|nr:stalk-specific protein X [Phenylobacterium glaciei]
MAIMITKWMLRGTSIAVLTLAGCSGPTSHEVAPPPDAYTQAPPPELMGGAPGARSDDSGLAGGPPGPYAEATPYRAPSRYVNRLVTYRRADGVLVTAMRPVPNPEDMSARERRLVYGARYAPRAYVSSSSRVRHPAPAYYAPAKAVPARPAAHPVVAAKPAAKPMVVAAKPVAPVAKPVIAVAPLKAIEQAKPAPAPKPVPALAKAPQPSFPATGLPVPADAKLAKLQTAVGGEVASGSKLTVPDAVTKGQPGAVSLTLPQTLLATIQREAAKLGLTKAAKKAEVTATLSGTGYEITPNGPQTAKLKTGEAAAFNWQVKPGAGERGPLKADVDAKLTGVKPAMTFSLASLEQALAAVMPEAPVKKGFSFKGLLSKLTIPGMKDISVPGVGRVPSNKVVAGALVLAALALLIALARGAGESRRRAERRRKFRTMTDNGATSHSEPEEEHHHGIAAPLAAAAAGAAIAGAIASHHHDEGHGDGHGHNAHDDHGHATADHGHAAHDDHGHAAHDDHGHAAAHDDHGHATAADHGHAADDHGHAAHDDHGHAAAHDDHGHAETHAVAHDDHGHDGHGHDAHAAHDDHGHAAEHHKEPEHAH